MTSSSSSSTVMGSEPIEVLETLPDLNDETIEELVQKSFQVLFQGFDPVHSVRIVQGWLNDSDDRAKTISQIQSILTFYSKRGTKVDDAKQRMSAKGREDLTQAMNALGISKSSGLQQSRNFMNIPRLAAALPHWIVQIRLVELSTEFGKEGPFPKSLLPREYQFPQAGSVLPFDSVLMTYWEAFMVDFDNLYNSGIVKDQDYLNKRANFIKIIKESKLFSQEKRLKMVSEFAIRAQILVSKKDLINKVQKGLRDEEPSKSKEEKKKKPETVGGKDDEKKRKESKTEDSKFVGTMRKIMDDLKNNRMQDDDFKSEAFKLMSAQGVKTFNPADHSISGWGKTKLVIKKNALNFEG